MVGGASPPPQRKGSSFTYLKITTLLSSRLENIAPDDATTDSWNGARAARLNYRKDCTVFTVTHSPPVK